MKRIDPADRLTCTDWVRGGLGGFTGAIFQGLIMVLGLDSSLLSTTVPALYGIEGPAPFSGWLFLLFHGTLLGVIYVFTIDREGVRRVVDPRTIRGGLFHGSSCGMMFSLLFGLTIMPLWLKIVGFPKAPPVPNLRWPDMGRITLGHLVHGNVLGVLYGVWRP